MSKFLLFLAFCTVAIVVADDASKTSVQFSADNLMTSSIKMPGVSMDIKMTGHMYYDFIRKRSRSDFTSMEVKMDIAGMPGGGDMPGGGGLPGFPGGTDTTTPTPTGTDTDPVTPTPGGFPVIPGFPPTSHALRRLQQIPGMPVMPKIVIDIQGTTLLRYDLHKNFTWYQDPETKQFVCTCVTLTEEMPQLFIPGSATPASAGASITVNSKTVTADHYQWKIALGNDAGAIATGFEAWSVAQNLQRVNFKVGVATSEGGSLMDTTISEDFWNHVELPQDKPDLFVPPKFCQCPTPVAPVIAVTATAYSVCAADSPEVKAQKCECPLADQTERLKVMPYCGDIVDYSLSRGLPFSMVDSQAEVTVQALLTGITVTTECLKAIREFHCKFFFTKCAITGMLLPPSPAEMISVAVCGANTEWLQAVVPGGGSPYNSELWGGYVTVSVEENSPGMGAGIIILIVILTLLAVAGAAFAVKKFVLDGGNSASGNDSGFQPMK